MAPPKRTPFERERDLYRIEVLYLQGKRQHEIAEELGVCRQQVTYDIKKLTTRWRESSIRDFDDAREKELAKIDELERTYWDAWVKSTKDREISTAERITSGKTGRDKAAKRVEGQTGNPSYLKGVEWCIERRCKLLGLDAPTKLESDVSYSIKLPEDFPAPAVAAPAAASHAADD